eukprot:5736376-Pleurochrysis_carterae.AAC.1
MTLMTSRISMAALRAQMPGRLWRMLNTLAPGLLASKDWTKNFTKYAIKFRPKPTTAAVKGVAAVMFDNYSRK